MPAPTGNSWPQNESTGSRPVRSMGWCDLLRRLLRERADLLGEAALMASGLVSVDDSLVHHAVDHRGGGGEGGSGLIVRARLQRQRCLTDGTAQLRGERVVTGTMHRRLSGSFFSRFRIRQAQTP